MQHNYVKRLALKFLIMLIYVKCLAQELDASAKAS